MRRAVLATTVIFFVATGAKSESGVASHFSTRDSGQSGSKVACPGRRLSDGDMVAAHKTLPCGSRVTVRNKRSGRAVIVTIIDRGPYVRGRIIDLSTAAARALGISGLGHVEVTH